MNTNIAKLYQIAKGETVNIIGLMSGTSLDGLDVALCTFTGSGLSTRVKLCHFATIPYSEKDKVKIRKIFAKQTIDFQHLCVLNPWIGNLHGEIVLECLKNWNLPASEVDIIASHGQTVYHSPKSLHKLERFPNSSLQIGDGDHIAVMTGIITISDFRQKQLAAGGEGAPLAVYGDYLLFSKYGETRIMLNIGGIANFTYLPGDMDADSVFSTDTGPGNTLLDAFANKLFGERYDKDGKFASEGNVNQELLNELKSDEFFNKDFPKTAGPETFNIDYVQNCRENSGQSKIFSKDLMATLTRFSAETIVDALVKCIQRMGKNNNNSVIIYCSGGGAHNKQLMTHLRGLLKSVVFDTTDTLGIPGDAKEAVLFATLANEALRGGRINFGNRKSIPSVSMGKISFPD